MQLLLVILAAVALASAQSGNCTAPHDNSDGISFPGPCRYVPTQISYPGASYDVDYSPSQITYYLRVGDQRTWIGSLPNIASCSTQINTCNSPYNGGGYREILERSAPADGAYETVEADNTTIGYSKLKFDSFNIPNSPSLNSGHNLYYSMSLKSGSLAFTISALYGPISLSGTGSGIWSIIATTTISGTTTNYFGWNPSVGDTVFAVIKKVSGVWTLNATSLSSNSQLIVSLNNVVGTPTKAQVRLSTFGCTSCTNMPPGTPPNPPNVSSRGNYINWSVTLANGNNLANPGFAVTDDQTVCGPNTGSVDTVNQNVVIGHNTVF